MQIDTKKDYIESLLQAESNIKHFKDAMLNHNLDAAMTHIINALTDIKLVKNYIALLHQQKR
jgi:hypothetical protein